MCSLPRRHPAIFTCFPHTTVWQTSSANCAFPELQKDREHCSPLVLYPQTHWDESSVLLPSRCGPTWPHKHSLPYSLRITSFLPLRYRRYSAENSLSKASSPTYFSPRLWLFLNLETKNLMSLLSASFMAGVTIYSCFLSALQVLV